MIKKYLIIILALIIIISGGLIYFFTFNNNALISQFPDNNPNTDSGNNQDPNNIKYAIKFTFPETETYNINKNGPFKAIPVNGVIYGSDLGKVKYISVTWHDDIDYSRRIGKNPPSSDSTVKTSIYDQYNINFETEMLIERLGTGSHKLQAILYDINKNKLANASVNIVIPKYWEYKFDSRKDHSDTPGSIKIGSYYYSFEMPYIQESNIDLWTNDIHRLQGKLYQIEGSFHIVNNEYPEVKIYLSFWNNDLNRWNKEDMVYAQGSGWYDFQGYYMHWVNWISFSCEKTDVTVDGFVGTIYIYPGTYYYQMEPLDLIFNLFNNDSLDKPPTR